MNTDIHKKNVNFPIWIALAIFTICTLIMFNEQIFGKAYFWEDFTEYVYPTQNFAATETAKGVIPQWNPYTFSGMPFIADIQVGYFYPPNRLMSLFVDSTNRLPIKALELLIIFHFLLAQVNMYLLCKYWKISSIGAVIAAITYAFSSIFICHVMHPMIIDHLAWLPLVVMFSVKGLDTGKFYCACLAGLILGMSMLSGHPQITLFEVFFLGLIFLWYFIRGLVRKEIKGLRIPKFFILGLIPFIFAVGIFSIQYFPSKELAGLSQRSEMSYEKASEGSLQFKQILTGIVPKLFGSVDGSGSRNLPFHLENAPYYYYWETAFYFGVIALMLGLFTAINKFKSKEILFFVVVSVFGFLFAMGNNSFIYEIFYNLPLFGSFRNPGRMMMIVIFSFSILAGIGFDTIWQKQGDKKTLRHILYAALVRGFFALLIAGGLLLGFFDTPQKYQSPIQTYGLTALIMITIAFTILTLISRKKLNPALGGILLIVAIFIDLTMTRYSFNVSLDNPIKKYEVPANLKAKFTPAGIDDLFRVSVRLYNPSVIAMQRNQGLIDRMMLEEGYNPLVLEKSRPPVISKDVYHDLNNVRYELAIDSAAGTTFFKERKTYFPRAWIVHNAMQFNPSEVKEKMEKNNYDYKTTAIIEETPTDALSRNPLQDTLDKVRCLEYSDNHFKYQFSSKENGILCFSEIWYPAWKAYLDGREINIMKVDYCYRGVSFPAGEHTIEMRYDSQAYSTGKNITILTLILSLAGIVLSMIFQKKKS